MSGDLTVTAAQIIDLPLVTIILADKRDGKPLAATEGPFRIVAPGDKRPARWIRQVTAFRIIVAK